jgi:hypothetical protein
MNTSRSFLQGLLNEILGEKGMILFNLKKTFLAS